MFLSFSTLCFHYGIALGGIAIALAGTASVGTLNSLQKKELAGDIASHGLLPGLLFSFLVIGKRHIGWGTFGAFCSGVLALACMRWLHQHKKISQDTALALTLSFFLGQGIFLIIYIQHHGGAGQAGLQSYFLGNIASLMKEDIYLLYALGTITLGCIWIFIKKWTWLCFDASHAKAMGAPVKMLHMILEALTVVSIIAGAQLMGILLVIAMLVIPTVAARFWTRRVAPLLLLASFFASLAGIGAALSSYCWKPMPVGPVAILLLSLFTFISLVFAPEQGLWARWWEKKAFKQKILEENILKRLFELGAQNEKSAINVQEVMGDPVLAQEKVRTTLMQLVYKGLAKVHKEKKTWYLTDQGMDIGCTMLRRHRLWEAYLEEKLHIQASHVHDDAESTEHLINQEIEEALKKYKSPKPR